VGIFGQTIQENPVNHRLWQRKIGAKGGKAGIGKAKARSSEQARNAALIRWNKFREMSRLSLKSKQQKKAT
jgi:hypothetical protein